MAGGVSETSLTAFTWLKRSLDSGSTTHTSAAGSIAILTVKHHWEESPRCARWGVSVKAASQRQMEIDPIIQQETLEGQDLTPGVEDSPFGLQHHQYIALTMAIPKLGLFPSRSCLGSRFFQLTQPLSQETLDREGRLHLAEGLQDSVGIDLQGLLGVTSGDVDLTSEAPSLKDGLCQAAQKTPDGVVPIQQAQQ